MVRTVYEGKIYSYTKSGWVDSLNVLVSDKFQEFLTEQAVTEGAEEGTFVKPEPEPESPTTILSDEPKKRGGRRKKVKEKNPITDGIKLFP